MNHYFFRLCVLLGFLTMTMEIGAEDISLNDFTYNEAEGYYEISTVEDMLNLSTYVSKRNSCEGLTFKVVVGELDFGEVENFSPIGFNPSIPSSSDFSGTFDGNHAVIKNLRINSIYSNVGLFASVNKGTIENVIMDATCSISGGGGSGSIAGSLSYGMILNCSSSASVEGPYIVGGIVGWGSDAVVSESTFDGIVTGRSSLGGITGSLYNSSVVKNCCNKGQINRTGQLATYGDMVGGIVGQNAGSSSIVNCSNIADLSSNNHIGGIVGDNDKGIVRNCTNTGNITAEAGQAGGIVGYNVNIPVNGRRVPGIIDCTNSGSITAQYFGGGIAGGNYGAIIRCTNSGNVTCGKVEDGKYATGDVKYSSWCGGIFGYGIGGEVIDSKVTKDVVVKAEAGCVGGVAGFNAGGFYSGCIVEEAVVKSEGQLVGGIVGTEPAGGMVIQNCINKAEVSGSQYVGGLAAEIAGGGVVSNSMNMGNVSAVYYYAGGIVGKGDTGKNLSLFIDQCQNSGNVTAKGYAAGILAKGYGKGLIRNCLVTGGTITSSDYAGAVAGDIKNPLSENYYTEDVVVIHNGKTYDGTTPRGVGASIKNEPYDLPEAIVDDTTFYHCAMLKSDYEPVQPITLKDFAQIADSIYAIDSVEDMIRLSDYVNAGNSCEGLTFRVNVPVLDFSEVQDFKPVGHEGCRFAGTFEGQGVSISNLQIEKDSLSSCVGMFGNVTGAVRDVHLASSCTISGGQFVGGIAGKCWGSIEDCTVGDDSAAAEVRQNRSEENTVFQIEGKSEVGGLVGGLFYGHISDCRVVGGMVSGNNFVGSVLGYNFNGVLSENYYEQAVTVKVDGTVYDGEMPRGLGAEAGKDPVDVAESIVDGVTYLNGIARYIKTNPEEEAQYWFELRETLDYAADLKNQAQSDSIKDKVEPWMIEELEQFIERGEEMYSEHTADEEEVRHMIEELNWICMEIMEAMNRTPDDGSVGIEKNEMKNKDSRSGNWFSLTGQHLNTKPTQKGVYIQGNKKRVVR